MSNFSKPVLKGIVKLSGGHLLRDGKVIRDDQWFDTGVREVLDEDHISKYSTEYNASIVNPQRRFWEAVKMKDYAAHMEFDVSEWLIVPGFLDIQTNGAFGVDFTSIPEMMEDGKVASISERDCDKSGFGCTEMMCGVKLQAKTEFPHSTSYTSPVLEPHDHYHPNPHDEDQIGKLWPSSSSSYISRSGMYRKEHSNIQNTSCQNSNSNIASIPVESFAEEYMTTYDVDQSMLAERFTQYGVTSFCPTIISSSKAVYSAVCGRFMNYMAHFAECRYHGGVLRQAEMLGLHLEGPFISIKGAHDPLVLRAPESMADVVDIYGGDDVLQHTSIVTLAPELAGSQEVITEQSKRNVLVSMGHSKATFQEAEAASEAGAGLITHLFNAMTPFHHRDPGLIGLLGVGQPTQHYSLIADGVHAHPSSVNMAFQSHPRGAVLVTDSMAAMGLGAGVYNLGEVAVQVCQQGTSLRAVVEGSNTLAGAIEPLDTCLTNFRKFTNCSIPEAVATVTEHPARALGIYPKKGSLKIGADADLVLLHPKTLQVMATIVNGQIAYVYQNKQFPPQQQ